MAVKDDTDPSSSHAHSVDEVEHYGPHHAPEWQPWDTTSKVIVAMGIIAICGLIAVFVALSFNH